MSESITTTVGKVAPVPKGTWDSALTYGFLDIVTYSSSSYIAKVDVPAGKTPSSETTYWQCLAGGGGGVSIPSITLVQGQVPGEYINFTDEQAEIIEDEGNLIIEIIDQSQSNTATSIIYTKLSESQSGEILALYLINAIYGIIYYDFNEKIGYPMPFSYEDNTNKVTSWSSSPSDTKYPSEKLVYNTINELGQKVTSWSSTASDNNYPSEKLVYDTIGNVSDLLDALLNGVS